MASKEALRAKIRELEAENARLREERNAAIATAQALPKPPYPSPWPPADYEDEIEGSPT